MLSQLNQDSSNPNFIPPAIWHLCKTLLDRSFYPDFSRHVEKPTQNLTPQPPSLLGNGENSKPLKKQERGFPDLAKSKSFYPNKIIILCNEIVLDKTKIFRIRARLLNLDRFNRSSLLVIIENKCESLKNIALAEVRKYELTPREAEIWYLYRAKHSYKEIAAQLYITVNTVKKHMKNIHAKRQAFLDCEN
ncbi:helix-turn-helix transcriptional regulator [Tolypothrix campylonemoides VB511288]|nr:helix-turn-helix transcriptional regulator [Tolypothrix campylonemoides VB511288]